MVWAASFLAMIAQNTDIKGARKIERQCIVTKYANNFFKACPQHKRAHFRKMIKYGTAYLEWADDRSHYLIVTDPGRNDEAIFACLSEPGKVS